GSDPAGPANGGAVAQASAAPATGTSPSGSPGRGTVAGTQPGQTVAAAEAMTDTPPVVPARLRGLDLGPACNQCGGMMQRTGSCYTWSCCGYNSGCGWRKERRP